MRSHGVRPGQIALLRCEAAAVPSPVFEWYKGEKSEEHDTGSLWQLHLCGRQQVGNSQRQCASDS
ncbi:Neuronal growth regulator 1 [Labeo rohita]|uniref:Neuronal growth regulator 1 n=1 Tax=Labeo rohita TaxID=84645 RepID=A0ABQ8MLD8_LABRO|nr:Neuronal growth regulator 1 [Labeo rohita]